MLWCGFDVQVVECWLPHKKFYDFGDEAYNQIYSRVIIMSMLKKSVSRSLFVEIVKSRIFCNFIPRVIHANKLSKSYFLAVLFQRRTSLFLFQSTESRMHWMQIVFVMKPWYDGALSLYLPHTQTVAQEKENLKVSFCLFVSMRAFSFSTLSIIIHLHNINWMNLRPSETIIHNFHRVMDSTLECR